LEGAAQLADIQAGLIQTSCGMAAPFMEYDH
jgi:hypothetical protein